MPFSLRDQDVVIAEVWPKTRTASWFSFNLTADQVMLCTEAVDRETSAETLLGSYKWTACRPRGIRWSREV